MITSNKNNIKREDYVLFYKTSTTPFYPGCYVALSHTYKFDDLLKIKCSSFEIIFTSKKEVCNWFYNVEMRSTAKKFENILFKKEFVDFIEQQTQQLEEEFNHSLKTKISDLFNETKFNNKGVAVFNKLVKLITTYSGLTDLPLFMCQVFFEDKFNNSILALISGAKQEKQDKFNILTSTSYETNYEKYLKQLLSAILGKVTAKEIAEKYYWLLHDYLGTIIDEEYVLKDIKKYKNNINELKQKIDSALLRINTFNKKINNCSKELKEKILAYQQLNWLYNEQKKFIIPSASIFLRRLFEYKFKGLQFNQLKKLFMLTPDELISILKSDVVLADVLSKIPENLQYRLFDGKISKLGSEYQNLTEINNNLKFLKGMTAYPGKITGKARIILNQSQINTFHENEILVAPFTNVNYLPVMHKAKAILTETGGLTSHAAIISRELKKPCIVGIKHLVDFLNNDDLIEIDTDTGTIKKLNNV